MKQENTNRKEKMIIVEKSTKWWMTVVASGSLAVGLLGGLGIGSLATNALNQQTKVQTSTTTQTQKNQQGNQGAPGIPPGGQSGNNQGGPNGRPSQQNGDQNDNGNSQSGSGKSNNSQKKLHQMLTVRLNQTKIVVRQKIMTQIQQILNILEKVML